MDRFLDLAQGYGQHWRKLVSTMPQRSQTTRERHCQSCRYEGMAWTLLMSGTVYLRRVLTWLPMVWYQPFRQAPLFSFMVPIFFRLSFLASVCLFQSPPVVSLVPVLAHASNHRACPSYGHEQVWGNLRSNRTKNVRRRLRRTEELVCWTKRNEVDCKFRRIRTLEVLV